MLGAGNSGARILARRVLTNRSWRRQVRRGVDPLASAQLEGADQLIEISETGTRMTDATGAEHVLTQRGAR